MANEGFKTVKYWGRALALATGLAAGFFLRRAAYYSPVREEFLDIVATHSAQVQFLREQPVPAPSISNDRTQ